MSQIHHISIPVQDTPHVAEVLQGLFGGTITPFGPYPNSYIVWFGDAHGSAIELFPVGTEMFPDAGDGQAKFRHNPSHTGFTATHAAISINRSRAEIFEVANENGWKAAELSRGSFNVIEFWIENRIMIELLTPDMALEYLAVTKRFRP
ncbi:MAG: hypothetical protein KDB05_30715 [Planctomycetales bacterium]|nr:hypothetical protein [Planctomycetales bacterium]